MEKKLFKRLLSAAIAAAMLLGAAPVLAEDAVPAAALTAVEAADPFKNTYNVIVNKSTGRVIAVENNGTNNLDLIVTEELALESSGKPSAGQIWRLAPLSGGLCYAVNKHSGRSLDVPDAKKESGVQLIQYSYNGNAQQKMLFEKDGDAYTIKPSHADMYLADVDGKVVQISEKSSEAAKWTLKTVSGSLMEKAKDSEGYKLLSDDLKRAFDNYFFSALDLSRDVYNNAETLLSTRDYENLSAEMQKRVLTTALTYTASGQVVGNVVNEKVAPYKIVSQEQVKDFDIWRGSLCTAWVFQVEMDGDVPGQVHKFQFATNEEDPNAEMITKSIEAIGVFPYALRQHVHYLYWKKGDTANSYNGGGNSIWIRLTWEPSRQQISQTLSHELGHVLEQNMLNDPDVWSLAERLDATPISSYGSSNETEDLAEFSRLYWTNLGKDTFAELGKVYPNRLKIFEGLLYRADKEYFKDYSESEKYIEELTAAARSAGSDSDNSSLDESKLYKIVDLSTDRAWTVPGNSKDNDVALTLNRYTAAAGQHFRIEKYGNKIKIISANSGKPIQLDDSALSGKNIAQYGGTWAIDEKFAVYPQEDGTLALMAPRYQLYVYPFGEAAGQAVEPKGWAFIEVGEADVKKGLLSVNGLSLKAADPVDEDSVATVSAGVTGSEWRLSSAEEEGCYKIIEIESGLSFDILNGSTEPGAALILYDYYGSANQLFTVENVYGGGFRLKNKNSGLYLTVHADGSVTQEYLGGAGQVFEM